MGGIKQGVGRKSGNFTGRSKQQENLRALHSSRTATASARALSLFEKPSISSGFLALPNTFLPGLARVLLPVFPPGQRETMKVNRRTGTCSHTCAIITGFSTPSSSSIEDLADPYYNYGFTFPCSFPCEKYRGLARGGRSFRGRSFPRKGCAWKSATFCFDWCHCRHRRFKSKVPLASC